MSAMPNTIPTELDRDAAVRYVAENFFADNIVAGIREAAQRSSDSLDIGPAFTIIIERSSLRDDRHIQYNGAVSLVPAILRELIRNDIKFHGAEAGFAGAAAHTDGSACDYVEMAEEMIREPSLVPRVNNVKDVERKLTELRHLIGALSREEAHQLAFHREDSTPAWDTMVCAIRYPNWTSYIPHTDVEESRYLYS